MRGKTTGHGEKQKWFIDRGGIEGWEEVSEKEFHRLLPSQSFDTGGGQLFFGWEPIHSEGMAVHPRKIPEAIESAKKHGVPTDFDKHGRPIFTSRSHRTAYLKAYKCHDNDGGYGDG